MNKMSHNNRYHAKWQKIFNRYCIRRRGKPYWYSYDGEIWHDSYGKRLPENEFSCQGEEIELHQGPRDGDIVRGNNINA